jgi:hypothetical protein
MLEIVGVDSRWGCYNSLTKADEIGRGGGGLLDAVER